MFVLIILSIMCFLMVFKSPQAADTFFEGLVNIRIHALAFLPILFTIFMLVAIFQSIFLKNTALTAETVRAVLGFKRPYLWSTSYMWPMSSSTLLE